MINQYQTEINNYINKYIINNQKSNTLQDLLKYTLDNGKRLRPMISLEIYKIISKDNLTDQIILSSLAIELLHNASLILDDMPCMDNDKYRRGKETIHHKYGLCVANFLSHHLIYQAFQYYLESNNSKLISIISQYTTDISIGQYYDLYQDSNNDVDTLIDKISMKTYPLFAIAFLSGYLLGGGDVNKIPIIKNIAKSFSISFQICDDLEDLISDSSKKISDGTNYVMLLGIPGAIKLHTKHIIYFKNTMKDLNLYSSLFIELSNYLDNKIEKYIK